MCNIFSGPRMTLLGKLNYPSRSFRVTHKEKEKVRERVTQEKKNNICVGRESNPGQLLGRQLCSPLYHQRFHIKFMKNEDTNCSWQVPNKTVKSLDHKN